MNSKRGTEQDIRNQFEAAGFEIVEDRRSTAAFGVNKYNCLCFLKSDTTGSAVPSGLPYFMIRGLNCELEDRGYQKFWRHVDNRFPIRQADLKALHRFDEEVRSVLGLKSLYHESLGTTCARSEYDRLDGRPDK